ncbi:MFS transporter [marine bacterium AO1-C]|nr:MFS transporter [marine bacterium AO1-C]
MKNHPKGLFILFFTEMWERFSYYGLRAILVLFLVSKTKGGYGWTEAEALSLLGLFTGMVYIMSIPGGIISDRWLGPKRSVMLGGLLLCIGHFLMAVPNQTLFYAALCIIVAGIGMLKPNISTMVGELYTEQKKRDAGFIIFYMGINLGSFLATLSIGFVAETYGWHYGFSLAGFGMLLGQIVFVWGQRYLQEVGNQLKTRKSGPKEKLKLSPTDLRRIMVLGILFFVIFVFWMSFEQASGLMNLYAKKYTNRVVFGWNVPASMFQSFNAGFILIFGGVVAAFWAARKTSAISKMAIGTILVGIGFLFMVGASMERASVGQSAIYWLVLAYWLHTLGELCISPVALSYISKIAPKALVSSMMGAYFAATGFANMAAAEVGKLAGKLGELSIFAGLVIISVVTGTILLLFARKLTKITREDEIEEMPSKTTESASVA